MWWKSDSFFGSKTPSELKKVSTDKGSQVTVDFLISVLEL